MLDDTRQDGHQHKSERRSDTNDAGEAEKAERNEVQWDKKDTTDDLPLSHSQGWYQEVHGIAEKDDQCYTCRYHDEAEEYSSCTAGLGTIAGVCYVGICSQGLIGVEAACENFGGVGRR